MSQNFGKSKTNMVVSSLTLTMTLALVSSCGVLQKKDDDTNPDASGPGTVTQESVDNALRVFKKYFEPERYFQVKRIVSEMAAPVSLKTVTSYQYDGEKYTRIIENSEASGGLITRTTSQLSSKECDPETETYESKKSPTSNFVKRTENTCKDDKLMSSVTRITRDSKPEELYSSTTNVRDSRGRVVSEERVNQSSSGKVSKYEYSYVDNESNAAVELFSIDGTPVSKTLRDDSAGTQTTLAYDPSSKDYINETRFVKKFSSEKAALLSIWGVREASVSEYRYLSGSEKIQQNCTENGDGFSCSYESNQGSGTSLNRTVFQYELIPVYVSENDLAVLYAPKYVKDGKVRIQYVVKSSKESTTAGSKSYVVDSTYEYNDKGRRTKATLKGSESSASDLSVEETVFDMDGFRPLKQTKTLNGKLEESRVYEY